MIVEYYSLVREVIYFNLLNIESSSPNQINVEFEKRVKSIMIGITHQIALFASIGPNLIRRMLELNDLLTQILVSRRDLYYNTTQASTKMSRILYVEPCRTNFRL